MKRQLYFPPRRAEQNLWLARFQHALPSIAARLEIAEAEVAETLADIEWLLYLRRDLRGALEQATLAATALENLLGDGEGNAPVLPLEVILPAPPAIPAVKPGALKRLFRLVRVIKNRPAYTEVMGQELGIEGNHYHRNSPVPTFTLRTEPGPDGRPVVIIKYSRQSHIGVHAQRRRDEGEWEVVSGGLLTGSVFRDIHPLLDPGRPEMREYRLRFWQGSGPIGEWTDIQRITVSP